METPEFIPDSTPDFIPDASAHLSAEARQTGAAFGDQTQGSALGRFLKAGASRYIGATLNAGPTNAVAQSYGTPEWQQLEANPPKTNSEALGRMWQTIRNAVSAPGHVDPVAAGIDLAKQFNPIDVQKFQSGDTAGGLGSSLMNLLLIRSGFRQMRGVSAPEFGSPNAYAEVVSPLSGYTKAQSTPAQAPSSTVQAPPSNSILPNATYLQPEMRALLRPKAAPPASEINKDVNTNVQDYFIQKMREQMNRQNVTGSAEQDAAVQRMNDYAKTPFDRATPKSAATVENASNLNSPGQVRGFQEQAAMELFGKSYDSLTIQEKLQTISEATRFQNEARATTPRVPTSDADMQNLFMQSIQMVRNRTR